ncbi:hypothetical protein [Rhodovulum sulfidophilum]|uniref:hypothetical protein n=1 Tax=Rhodovulum sulfidophilum TaxID=35806 RepID=UPI001389BBF9|nr:hypothetical protein [Rhodovulum sulfidophilum]NDK36840.1 hypothetical protein [Rhodovulum sulfidophilum]
MGLPYALILRLRIAPEALRQGLVTPGPGFDGHDDWERLPIILGNDLPQIARNGAAMSPGHFLAEARSYSARRHGFLFDYDAGHQQLICLDLLHSDSWSVLILTLSRLRNLAATEGYLLIHDLISGADETHAALEFRDGASRVLDIDSGEADALIADARAIAGSWLEALQAAGEGPLPELPDQFESWWRG